MGYTNLLLAVLLLSAVAVNGQSYWEERGNSSSLTDWLVIVEAGGDAPSSANNANAEFIVAWNNILIDYLGLAANSTQITTTISPTASDPWMYESAVTGLNANQSSLLRDLEGDDCTCWATFNAEIDNATTTTLDIDSVTVSEQTEPSSSSSDDDDDKFGTGEIVGIVFGALLIYYCCFMVAAGIFYMLKALFKKLRSREREGLDSEEDEELGDMGKDDDSEDEHEDESEEDESSSESESDSGKKDSSSGNTTESSEESSSDESSSEESS